MYAQKKSNFNLDENRNLFLPYSAECKYQLKFRATDTPLGIATFFHPTQVRNHKQN